MKLFLAGLFIGFCAGFFVAALSQLTSRCDRKLALGKVPGNRPLRSRDAVANEMMGEWRI